MITLNNINLSSIDLSGIDLRGIKLGLGGRGGGSGDGFPQLPGDVTRWHFGGLTNEMMAAMDDPRIEDADGKGRFLSFKNFAWGGMSGVNGYVQNFNYFRNNATVDKVRIDEQSSNSIKVTLLTSGVGHVIYIPKDVYQFNKSYFIKISSEGYNEGDLFLSFYAPSTSTATTVKVPLNPNGITEIPAIKEDDFLAVYLFNAAGKVGSITIEQLPLYPGALVFDGVDDYGVCDNFPILTKEKGYTVVALRQWISKGEELCGLVSNAKNWFKDGAFILEYSYTKKSYFNRPVSFGAIGSEKDLPHILTYQTSKSYNGVSITAGSFKGTNSLFVGKLNNIIGNCSNAAIWELVFLDHDATEEELTKIKDYFVKTYPWLFPDQAWTVTGKTNEDEDRATIANITGNGNDLVLSNFGFSGNSGYGEYAYNFSDTSWISIPDYGVISDKTSKSFNIKSFVLADYPVLYTAVNKDSSIKKVKIKVTNSIPGFYFGNKPANQIIDLSTDGIYEIPSYNSPNDVTQYGFRCSNVNDSCNITIEQIPEYEGYLVTDGVDDRVVSSSFTLNKDWTIVGNWKMLQPEANKSAGIVKQNSLFIYNHVDGLSISINAAYSSFKLKDIRSVNAICSDGRIYLNDWTEIIDSKQQTVNESVGTLVIGILGNVYTSLAFKNMSIYSNQVLSKDDCIKAYNYLQTLKAK